MENKIKRTSSDSTQPKIKLALEEKYKEEDQKEVDGYERLKTKESANVNNYWKNISEINKKSKNTQNVQNC